MSFGQMVLDQKTLDQLKETHGLGAQKNDTYAMRGIAEAMSCESKIACLFVYLSVCLSFSLWICYSTGMTVSQSVCMSVCLLVYLFVYLCVCVSVCLSVFGSVIKWRFVVDIDGLSDPV